MKTIKWQEEQFKQVQDDLADYLSNNGFDVVDTADYKNENYSWDVTSELGQKKTLIKNRMNSQSTSGDLLRFYFEENEAEQALINPTYILIDEENKMMNIIFMRSQDSSKSTGGTVFQKMGSFTFVRSDYMNRYEKIFEYDIDVTVILNNFFESKTYKNFITQLKQNSINVWINQIKI